LAMKLGFTPLAEQVRNEGVPKAVRVEPVGLPAVDGYGVLRRPEPREPQAGLPEALPALGAPELLGKDHQPSVVALMLLDAHPHGDGLGLAEAA